MFVLVWIARGKPLMELSAWGLHITLDIFTHNDAFFPTPFLWPISDAHVNGVPWSDPIIYFPNVLLLAVLYAWFFYKRKKSG